MSCSTEAERRSRCCQVLAGSPCISPRSWAARGVAGAVPSPATGSARTPTVPYNTHRGAHRIRRDMIGPFRQQIARLQSPIASAGGPSVVAGPAAGLHGLHSRRRKALALSRGARRRLPARILDSPPTTTATDSGSRLTAVSSAQTGRRLTQLVRPAQDRHHAQRPGGGPHQLHRLADGRRPRAGRAGRRAAPRSALSPHDGWPRSVVATHVHHPPPGRTSVGPGGRRRTRLAAGRGSGFLRSPCHGLVMMRLAARPRWGIRRTTHGEA